MIELTAALLGGAAANQLDKPISLIRDPGWELIARYITGVLTIILFGAMLIRRLHPDAMRDYLLSITGSAAGCGPGENRQGSDGGETVSESKVVSKCGIHSVGARRGGYGDLLQTVYRSGRRLAIVKCRSDMGAAWEARQLWHDCFTVGAWDEFNGLSVNAANLFRQIDRNPWLSAVEVCNEVNGEWARQTDLYMTLLPALAARGVTLVAYNCAEGTPQYPNIDPLPYFEINRLCEWALINGYGSNLVVGLHEYGYGVDHVQRYHVLKDYLEERGNLVPFAITEYGPIEAGRLPVQEALDYIAANDQPDMLDDNLIGRALWTTGGGWVDNFADWLPPLGQYIATVEKPYVPPVGMVGFKGMAHRQYVAELTDYCNERGIKIAFAEGA